MLKFKLFGLAAMAMALLIGAGVYALDDKKDEKPKYTIKEVMTKAHKDGLLKKVSTGKGEGDDAKMLLELYTALAANKPPKGDEKAWKERTASIVEAAKGFVDGKGDAKKLGMATMCKSCHDTFK
jgi:hypothetical protein